MSDLSRLLGDVYGASSTPTDDVDATDATAPMAAPAPDDPPAPPVEAVDDLGGPVAPGWADDEVLDEAFADWVPGPPPDASAEERGMLDDVEPAESVAEAIDIDAWLGTEVVDDDADTEQDATESLDAFVPVPVPVPEPAVEDEPAHDGPWSRERDDLLPRARRGRRLNLSLRR